MGVLSPFSPPETSRGRSALVPPRGSGLRLVLPLVVTMLAVLSACGDGSDTASGPATSAVPPTVAGVQESAGDPLVASLLDETVGDAFDVGGVTFRRAVLEDPPDAASPTAYDYVIDPTIKATLPSDLSLYERQLQYVVDRLHSEAVARRGFLLGAGYRTFPDLDAGVSVLATVLIDNPVTEPITDLVVDAEIVRAGGADDGEVVARGRFELDRANHGVLAPDTMLLTNLVFPPARVQVDDADFALNHRVDIELTWDPA